VKVSAALAKAGETYLALNKHYLAADCFYRAARNAAAWDNNAKAKEWALAALSAARETDDSIVAHLAESLLSEPSVNQP
jgi:hypothetical protein